MANKILCQQGGYSCMGCCGYDWKEKDIKKAVDDNTEELIQIRDKSVFRDRADKDDLKPCGACRNIVMLDEKTVGCPLHPVLNNGVDLRKGHCDTNFWCETMKWFRKLDRKTQERFISFVDKQKPDWVTYSMGMDSGTFMQSFLGKNLLTIKLIK
jgi:hypothetical protein